MESLGLAAAMMWIVQLALRRPYTFIVLAILILLLGTLSILRTPTDIFPNVRIPVVGIVWTFNGMDAQQLSDRIVTITERTLTTTVDNIEHLESQSLDGVAVVKVFLQPKADVVRGIAQIAAVSQTQLRQLPAGTTPPLVIAYSASQVPVIQLGLSGKGMSEQELFNLGVNFIRTRLITVPGAAVPYPYGGKFPEVVVDLDTELLQSKAISPAEVVNAIAAQNLISPAGTAKIGTFEYDVNLNAAPVTIAELNELPIKSVGGTTIYVKDVAWVRNGFIPQTNIARVDGERGVLVTVNKTGEASTLDVIDGIKRVVPEIQPTLPSSLRITPHADQSIFVRAAISGVVREALIAAALTAVMILLFIGSWRSTIIIAVSIPLAILTSLTVLGLLGETINIMTLGGLALAVGILVDDATVEVENINRNAAMGKKIIPAILDGARQIATPAFVATIAICIVFVPMFFLGGVARYLFVPLAEAVVFAMLASYLLSRTLVPTLARYLLREQPGEPRPSRNPLVRFQRRFEHGFHHLRAHYCITLRWCVKHRIAFILLSLAFFVGSLVAIVPWLGRNFFPAVDSGHFQLHMRARPGMRIEETARLTDEVEQFIRAQLPPREVDTIVDNIGIPYSGINLVYSASLPIGTSDSVILVALAKHHGPTADYLHELRLSLPRTFPGVEFAFEPPDIVSQILNFGLPAPIDIQITGADEAGNRHVAAELLQKLAKVPGVVDLTLHQPANRQVLDVSVDRTKASQLGLTMRDITTSVLTSLSGSFQTAPTFWLNTKTHVSYQIATQTPQYRIESLEALNNVPVTGSNATAPQILANVSSITRHANTPVVSHYDIQPVLDIFGGVQGRDLGAIAADIEDVVAATRPHLPRGTTLVTRGQIRTMQASYEGLIAGLAGAIVLIYLLMVVNFQSWLGPFIILTGLPAALAGIAWFLFLTQTPLSVPALMGIIMAMGVATSNSILVVTFANEAVAEGKEPRVAAIDAGFTRFRPVIMTALAMIIGMLPMSLGLGEGGEQNAPLGRAVIGGLLLATVSTLLFVPTMFSVLARKPARHDG
jgi:multidrug efflux pump subunit AcrB